MGTQQFIGQEQYRLEVEETPTGLVNLVQNASGELGGWAWVTPVVGSTMVGNSDTTYIAYGSKLVYTSPGTVASFFYTENLPVTAGQFVAASWLGRFLSATGAYRVRFEFLNAAFGLISSSTQTGFLLASLTNRQYYSAVVTPALTVYVRLRFDVYESNAGANPAAGRVMTLQEVTVAKAATSGALGSQRTNHITNPSFETNLTGWTGTSTRARVGTPTPDNRAFICSMTLTTTAAAFVLEWVDPSSINTLIPGRTYNLSFRVRSATVARRFLLRLSYRDAANASLGSPAGSYITSSTSAWTAITLNNLTIPAGTVTVIPKLYIESGGAIGEVHYCDAVKLEETATAGAYFDGASSGGGFTYAWTGTADASTSTETLNNLAFIPPVTYLEILGSAHRIDITRDELNVGLLDALVIDANLSPTTSTLIRPGKRVRVLASVTDTPSGVQTWEPLFLGKIDRAQVDYDLLNPNPVKRSRVSISAVDATSPLANASRPSGVATIADLPFVLEGAGIPWIVNGSSNQVPSATVVSSNPAATVLDQVAITRDTERGYAWVDRRGVLQAWTSALLSNTVQRAFTEADYSGLEIDYDTEVCINEVTIRYLRYNATTGETLEVMYGPYLDSTSIATYGRRSKEFTIHGGTESAATMLAYANAVLAANATPVVRINAITVPIRTAADINTPNSKAIRDLYDRVTLTNTAAGITAAPARITSIKHSITADKWLIRYGFNGIGSVAMPQITPPVQEVPNAGLPYAARHRAAALSIPNNVLTVVSFDTADAGQAQTSLTWAAGVWTVQRAGRYLINTVIQFLGNTTGRRLINIRINNVQRTRVEVDPDTTSDHSLHLTFLARMVVGDTISIDAFQTSGVALALVVGTSTTNAQITWLGE